MYFSQHRLEDITLGRTLVWMKPLFAIEAFKYQEQSYEYILEELGRLTHTPTLFL